MSRTTEKLRTRLGQACGRSDNDFLSLYDSVIKSLGPGVERNLIIEPSLKVSRHCQNVERYALTYNNPIVGTNLEHAYRRFAASFETMHAPEVVYNWLLNNIHREPRVAFGCDFSCDPPAFKAYLGVPTKARFRTPFCNQIGMPIWHSPSILSLEWRQGCTDTSLREYTQIWIRSAEELCTFLKDDWLVQHKNSERLTSQLLHFMDTRWCKESAVLQSKNGRPDKLLLSFNCCCISPHVQHGSTSAPTIAALRRELVELGESCGFDRAKLMTWIDAAGPYKFRWLGIRREAPIELSIYLAI